MRVHGDTHDDGGQRRVPHHLPDGVVLLLSGQFISIIVTPVCLGVAKSRYVQHLMCDVRLVLSGSVDTRKHGWYVFKGGGIVCGSLWKFKLVSLNFSPQVFACIDTSVDALRVAYYHACTSKILSGD